jgi:tetratricopeptide (TPR) repeat protein
MVSRLIQRWRWAQGDVPPHGRIVCRGASRLALLCCTFVAAACGCRSLSHQGPVPRSVATSRQLSQQGINAMEKGDWKRAESLLVRALQAHPADVEARRNYAEALWHRGAKEAAVGQIEEARRVAADDTGLAVRAGEMYLAMGQVEKAQQAAGDALDLDPKSAPAWSLRGQIFERTGHPRQALADYQRALGYVPGDTDLLLKLAETYRQVGMPSRALAALQTVIDTYPPGEEPQNLLYLQGLALIALGRYNDAVESLTVANQRGSPTAELLYRLGEAHLLAGRTTDAQAALQQALALEPAHPASRALAQRMHFGLGATTASANVPLQR